MLRASAYVLMKSVFQGSSEKKKKKKKNAEKKKLSF
jgi:hypothetical protein